MFEPKPGIRLRDQGLKRCPRCDTIKRLTDFNASRNTSDGRTTYCRPCDAERTRILRDNDEYRARSNARRRAKTVRKRAARSLDELTRPATPAVLARLAARESRSDVEADLAFDALRPAGKRCRVCRRKRGKDAFERDPATSDGRAWVCRACVELA